MSRLNFVEEMRWRGLLQEMMPGTDDLLKEGVVCGYAGFDPTADSLGIGNLVPLMMLKHLQRCGHKPLALVGGATGMIGDPSGKSAERNLLNEETLFQNIRGQQKQLERYLDFNEGPTGASLLNNYDWFREFGLLDFLREVGKHITVNYMMAKDSVQKRLESGLSFTEFSYQLLQGYDFLWLYKNKQCRLQVGGSDQWGNIVTGTELIRRKEGGEAYGLVCPLITKADGGKFGKTESGNIWLDRSRTSPYKFYQFWLNAADEDAGRYIRIFTLLDRAEIEALELEHRQAPHLRLLQKRLAREVTSFIHSEADTAFAIRASEVLFGNTTATALQEFSEQEFSEVFEGVPSGTVSRSMLESGIGMLELLTEQTGFLPSRGEARKLIQGKGISLNKTVIENTDSTVYPTALLCNKYLLLQKGRKNYFLVVIE